MKKIIEFAGTGLKHLLVITQIAINYQEIKMQQILGKKIELKVKATADSLHMNSSMNYINRSLSKPKPLKVKVMVDKKEVWLAVFTALGSGRYFGFVISQTENLRKNDVIEFSDTDVMAANSIDHFFTNKSDIDER